MTRKWKSFFDGIGLEYIPNERIFEVGDKKIKPGFFLPQLNCYFSVLSPLSRDKCLNHDFCSHISGFGLLVAFGEPHYMDMYLFSECYRENEDKKRTCARVFIAGYFSVSNNGRKYLNIGLSLTNISSRNQNICGFGYTDATGSIHAISANVDYNLLRKRDVFNTYDDVDLEEPIDDRLYIKSDFRDRETVKAYRGRWDPDAEMWYMTDFRDREDCKRALNVICEAREMEHEAHILEGWEKVRAYAEEVGFTELPSKAKVAEAVDKIWKDVRDEYKFTKKEIRKYVDDTYFPEGVDRI